MLLDKGENTSQLFSFFDFSRVNEEQQRRVERKEVRVRPFFDSMDNLLESKAGASDLIGWIGLDWITGKNSR